MERLYRNIGTLQSPLEKRPEVFDAVRVDFAAHVLLHVVHGLVYEEMCRVYAFIANVLIGIDVSAPPNVLQNLVLEGFTLRIRDDHSANLAGVPRPHAHHNRFLVAVLVSDATLGVHVPCTATDVGFVYLYLILRRAADLRKGLVLHRLANAVEHVPCTLLSDTDVAGKFVAGYPVLAVRNHPNCHHPFIQTQRGVLEDRAHLQAELLLAPIALPDTASLDESALLRPTTGASYHPIREPQFKGVLKSTVGIGEEDDCLLKCMRGLHIENVPLFFTCVKYVISLTR